MSCYEGLFVGVWSDHSVGVFAQLRSVRKRFALSRFARWRRAPLRSDSLRFAPVKGRVREDLVAEVRAEEVRLAEVRGLRPRRVPDRFTLFDKLEMFGICHRMTPRSSNRLIVLKSKPLLVIDAIKRLNDAVQKR